MIKAVKKGKWTQINDAYHKQGNIYRRFTHLKQDVDKYIARWAWKQLKPDFKDLAGRWQPTKYRIDDVLTILSARNKAKGKYMITKKAATELIYETVQLGVELHYLKLRIRRLKRAYKYEVNERGRYYRIMRNTDQLKEHLDKIRKDHVKLAFPWGHSDMHIEVIDASSISDCGVVCNRFASGDYYVNIVAMVNKPYPSVPYQKDNPASIREIDGLVTLGAILLSDKDGAQVWLAAYAKRLAPAKPYTWETHHGYIVVADGIAKHGETAGIAHKRVAREIVKQEKAV